MSTKINVVATIVLAAATTACGVGVVGGSEAPVEADYGNRQSYANNKELEIRDHGACIANGCGTGTCEEDVSRRTVYQRCRLLGAFVSPVEIPVTSLANWGGLEIPRVGIGQTCSGDVCTWGLSTGPTSDVATTLGQIIVLASCPAELPIIGGAWQREFYMNRYFGCVGNTPNQPTPPATPTPTPTPPSSNGSLGTNQECSSDSACQSGKCGCMKNTHAATTSARRYCLSPSVDLAVYWSGFNAYHCDSAHKGLGQVCTVNSQCRSSNCGHEACGDTNKKCLTWGQAPASGCNVPAPSSTTNLPPNAACTADSQCSSSTGVGVCGCYKRVSAGSTLTMHGYCLRHGVSLGDYWTQASFLSHCSESYRIKRLTEACSGDYQCRSNNCGYASCGASKTCLEPGAASASASCGSSAPPSSGYPGGPSQGSAYPSSTGSSSSGTCDLYKASAAHGDPCSCEGEWRCVQGTDVNAPVSQVCRAGIWQNYNTWPSDCDNCRGQYTYACGR